MSTARVAHPDSDRLAAFGLGQLGPTASADVEGHVAGCATCCQSLWTVPDDQLVALLRTSIGLPDAQAGVAANGSPQCEATVALTSVDAALAPERQQATEAIAAG